MTTLNDKPLIHDIWVDNQRVRFTADRCDLVGGVDVTYSARMPEQVLTAACFQFGWWHAVNITPQLNGFTGPTAFRLTKDLTR